MQGSRSLPDLLYLDAPREEHVHELAVGGPSAQLLDLGEPRLERDHAGQGEGQGYGDPGKQVLPTLITFHSNHNH